MALQVVKDTAISYIVQVALTKVFSCLQNGFELFLGAQNLLVKIKDSLVDIQDFIVIAERSPIRDPRLMKLLEKLKDAAYDAENITPVQDTLTNKVRRAVTSLVTAAPAVINRAQMPMKLKELSESLEALKAECHTFQLKEKVTKSINEFEKLMEKPGDTEFGNKSQVFGRDKETEELLSLLLSEDGEDEKISVIPIVGMGGIGKTTLASKVYKHKDVQNHFEPRTWTCASDDFDIIRLGNEIIESVIGHNPSLSNVEELRHRLEETLSGKKFLLVLDDVSNEDPEKWYRLRDLLLCGGRGSRIIVTTRSPKVASTMSNIQPHILKPLSEYDSWSLFHQRAFGNPIEEAAHPNLAQIARDIVEKCGGIPLAVVILGGLLRSERRKRKWESVRDSEMWNLDDENENGNITCFEDEERKKKKQRGGSGLLGSGLIEEGEDLPELRIEGDEDYELVPQYDYNDAILDGENEDV